MLEKLLKLEKIVYEWFGYDYNTIVRMFELRVKKFNKKIKKRSKLALNDHHNQTYLLPKKKFFQKFQTKKVTNYFISKRKSKLIEMFFCFWDDSYKFLYIIKMDNLRGFQKVTLTKEI